MIRHPLNTLKDYVTKFCGEAPVGFQQIDIKSNQILSLKMTRF